MKLRTLDGFYFFILFIFGGLGVVGLHAFDMYSGMLDKMKIYLVLATVLAFNKIILAWTNLIWFIDIYPLKKKTVKILHDLSHSPQFRTYPILKFAYDNG